MHGMLVVVIVGLIISLFNANGGSTSSGSKGAKVLEILKEGIFNLSSTKGGSKSKDPLNISPGDIFKGLKEVLLNPSNNSSKGTAIMEDFNAGSCDLKYFNRTLSRKKYLSKIIEIPFCVGHCASFYIPGSKISEDLESCKSCQPESHNLKKVTLSGLKRKKKKFTMELKYITSCRCSPCNAGDCEGSGEIGNPKESKEVGGSEESREVGSSEESREVGGPEESRETGGYEENGQNSDN